jgi:Ca2+-binding EF-hand superfamily protein
MNITNLGFATLTDDEILKSRTGFSELAITMLKDYFIALYEENQGNMTANEFVSEMIKFFDH